MALEKHLDPITTCTPNQNIIDKCDNWATDFLNNNSYYKNKGNLPKMHKDHFLGKLTEWATYAYFNKLKLRPTKPSMELSWNSNTKFPPDLMLNKIPVEVKNLTTNSWTFHIDHNPKGILVLTSTTPDLVIKFWAICKAKQFKFYPPISPKQQNKKKCIYSYDLYTHNYNLNVTEQLWQMKRKNG